MIKFNFLKTILFIGLGFSWAQDITYVEYYIDVDPGKGSAQQISIASPGQEVTLNFSVNTSGLKGGFHTLYVRGHDLNNSWSMLQARVFYIFQEIVSPPTPDVNYAEYFIDLDPGHGLASSIDIINFGEDINVSFGPDISALQAGFHTLYVRARDQNFGWTLFKAYAFYIPFEIETESSDVSKVQYYFGAGDYISEEFNAPELIADTSVTSSFVPNLTELFADSAYVLRIYAIDSNGKRSLDYVHEFTFMPDLAFSVYRFSFDSIAVGDSSSFSIPLFAYADSIEISGINMVDGSNYSVTTTSLPAQLNKGDSILIDLKFKPQKAGILNDTLLISSPSTINPVKLFVNGYGKTITSLIESESTIPKTLVLRQNYPNPFNPATTIKYDLPNAMNVEITIFNMLGQKIKHLLNKQQQAGVYSIQWDGKNEQGSRAPSGIYLYKIKAGKSTKSFKMVLLK